MLQYYQTYWLLKMITTTDNKSNNECHLTYICCYKEQHGWVLKYQ
jgi:hypothetical protein